MNTTTPQTTAFEYHEDYETTFAVVTGATAIASIIVTIFHSFKVYQDLYTTERKSLDHRRIKNKIDAPYLRLTRLTHITAILYTLLVVNAAIDKNFNKHCHIAPTLIGGIGFWWAKAGFYLTYILRLHQIYGLSAYGYKKRTMICWATTVIIFVLIFFVFSSIGNFTTTYIASDSDDRFPFPCQIDLPPFYRNIVGGGLLLFEVVAAIGSIIAFTIPLNQVIKTMRIGDGEDEENKLRYNKIVYSGHKYKVLVISSGLFTLSWILLYIIIPGAPTIPFIIGQIDFVFNPVCLLLMTPYYPSNIYYERLCFFCIRCCDPKGESYKRTAETEEKPVGSQSGARSIDTSQAVRHEAAQPAAKPVLMETVPEVTGAGITIDTLPPEATPPETTVNAPEDINAEK